MFGDHDGDVSCNSYELWEQDLACIKQLGLTHYRLSFSWSRLLPDGTTASVNQKGENPTFVRRPCGLLTRFQSSFQGCGTTTG